MIRNWFLHMLNLFRSSIWANLAFCMFIWATSIISFVVLCRIGIVKPYEVNYLAHMECVDRLGGLHHGVFAFLDRDGAFAFFSLFVKNVLLSKFLCGAVFHSMSDTCQVKFDSCQTGFNSCQNDILQVIFFVRLVIFMVSFTCQCTFSQVCSFVSVRTFEVL